MPFPLRRAVAAAGLLAAALAIGASGSPVDAAGPTYRAMHFPVDGKVTYTDTFGACRDGCTRAHQGQDLMGARLTPLIAAVDGTVTAIRTDSSGTSGNYVRITDAEGWHYYYMHVNNDSPSTDDGKNPAAWRFAPGIVLHASVYAAQFLGYMGDSGNAEGTSPHLHFEIRTPQGTPINAFESLNRASRAPAAPRIFVNDVLASASSSNTQWAQVGANVLACDIDGDGDDEPVQHLSRTFLWRNDITASGVTGTTTFGSPGDVPICGDWDGDGDDGLGIVRGTMWYVRNSFTGGPAELTVNHGVAGKAVAGDWDGDGDDDPGVLSGRVWHLRTATGVTRLTFGAPGDVPVSGDWDGNGVADIGVRRGVHYYARTVTETGTTVTSFGFGRTGDVALTADFDSDGDDTISLWRPRP